MSEMDFLCLMSILRLYPGLKMTFEHTTVRINLFLTACFCWDAKLSFCEMDQKTNFSGTIVYGDSYLNFLCHHFEAFRLHATLHDAAGNAQTQEGKDASNRYMIGRRQAHKNCAGKGYCSSFKCKELKIRPIVDPAFAEESVVLNTPSPIRALLILLP